MIQPIEGWGSVSSLHYDMRFMAVKKKKEQIELNNKPSPKKLLPLSRLHSTQTAPLVLFHQPSDLNFLSGHWGLYRVENVPTEWLQSIHFILP